MAGALGLGVATSSIAATIPVTSCADDGSFGTLRHAVVTAVSGDTVDMSTLACSTITLASGAIHVDVDPLTINGPGAARLTIDGNNADRIFYHSGTQTVTVSGVTITHGTASGALPAGGCIFSKGSIYFNNSVATACAATGSAAAYGGAMVALNSISLDNSTVTACTVTGTTLVGAGGVFAKNTVSLLSSALTNNRATSTGTTGSVQAVGGGAFGQQGLFLSHSLVSGNIARAANGRAGAGGAAGVASLTAKYSTVTGNQAIGKGTSTYLGKGGGLYGGTLTSGALIQNSTIDHNQADEVAGVVLAGTGTASITNSTISSNTATLASGGIDVSMNLNLSNSTIAFNIGGPGGAGGLYATSGFTADLESSIIADNSPSGSAGGADLAGTGTITGAHNLIKISSVPVPAGTLTADPKFGPLACNGGSTRTHALLPGSPAIDVGSAPTTLKVDQRGRGFPRAVGIAPDIGAYESDPDRIFTDGFDC
ncbi:choice-of-anchor Q domain-containing protein [Dokdonella soli]|uniref:Right-handed parallel beta-helix repeat-containing protein n=1 Tax=Dokdonella soli TaxID=529810 RepID=A0ABN1IXH3_9GAMM